MFFVISYDIADDRRRRAVAKVLEDFGMRVQESVLDCLLEDIALLDLQSKLVEVIDQDLDSVCFYGICAGCKTTSRSWGSGTSARIRTS